MKLKRFNYKKELKKVQKKGIYSKTFKYTCFYSILGLALISIFIYTSYAMYMYDSGKRTAYNTQASKKIKIHAIISNGNSEDGSLADKILKETPKANPTFTSSHTDKGLYVQQGDSTKSVEGKPTYYYRGNVENNYVEFAGSTWRIVRINEDETIRIVRTELIEGSTYGDTSTYTGSTAEAKLNTWYTNNLKQYEDFIAETEYCNDISGIGNQLRKNPPTIQSFVCRSTPIKLKIGLMTVDEWVYAGGIYDISTQNYLDYLNGWNWSMTTMYNNGTTHDLMFISGGYQYSDTANAGLIPVINLKSGTMVSGSGTSSNPYKVIGAVEPKEQITDYKTTTTMKVNPTPGYGYDDTKGVTCTNSQSGSYNKTTNTLTVNSPSKDTECTVNFKKMKLNEWIIANYPKVTNPDFTSGFPNSSTTSSQITAGSGLYATQDDSGTSYIFRGKVDNNYVHFANQDWRILRVNGDGTVRLMLKDKLTNNSKYNNYTYKYGTPQHDKVGFTREGDPCSIDSPCEVTYDNVTKIFTNQNGGTNSTIKDVLEDWYKTNLNEFDEQIVYGLFCNDISYGSGTDDGSTSTLYYGAYQRLRSSTTNVTPTLVCPEQVDKNKQTRTYGGLYKSKIGLITADELAMGGYSPVYNNSSKNTTDKNYLRRSYSYLTASPDSSNFNANVFTAYYTGRLDNYITFTSWAVVPVINLKTDNLTYSGTGEVGNEIVIR